MSNRFRLLCPYCHTCQSLAVAASRTVACWRSSGDIPGLPLRLTASMPYGRLVAGLQELYSCISQGSDGGRHGRRCESVQGDLYGVNGQEHNKVPGSSTPGHGRVLQWLWKIHGFMCFPYEHQGATPVPGIPRKEDDSIESGCMYARRNPRGIKDRSVVMPTGLPLGQTVVAICEVPGNCARTVSRRSPERRS